MKTLYTFPCAAALLLAGMTAHGAGSRDSTDIRIFPPGTGRVLAAEDTIPDPGRARYELPEIPVVDTRVPLREIIRKAQRGERDKYAGLKSMAYNRTFKTVLTFGGRKPRTECEETIQRIFYRAPGEWAAVTLKESRYEVDADGRRPLPLDDGDGPRISVRGGSKRDRDLASLPFYLERLDNFRFEITHRSVTDRTVLYEVDFEPLSDFNVSPGGKLWLLTPNYQIVREEFRMKNLPFPWIVKNVDLLTREWQQVENRWVERRIAGHVDLGLSFLKDVPRSVEFVLTFDRYEFDPVLDDALFSGGAR